MGARCLVDLDIFVTLIFLLLLTYCVGDHEYSVSCGLADDQGLVVTPDNGIASRYSIRWCTKSLPGQLVKKWSITLHVCQKQAEKCSHYSIKDRLMSHSKLKADINRSFNCSSEMICFATNIDLLYDGCYTIENELDTIPKKVQRDTQYIHNNYTLDLFNKHESYFSVLNEDDKVLLKIYNKYIPMEEYYLKLCNEKESTCDYAQNNCSTRTLYAAECELAAAPGPHSVTLEYSAPWIHGDVFSSRLKGVYYAFVNTGPAKSAVSGGAAGAGGAQWAAWGAGLGAAALVALLLALYYRRRRHKRTWRDRIYKAWRNGDGNALTAESKPAAEWSRVVLVYARDTQHFNTAMDVLRKILETKYVVVDLFRPEWVSKLSASPAASLQRLLSTSRVVFVQTPTAAVLYGDGPGGPGGVSSGRMCYRRPAFGDSLLPVALSSLRCPAGGVTSYSRHLICSLTALPSEFLPRSVPLTRYPLPEASHCLLRALGIRDLPTAHLTAFSTHLANHAAYVQANSDYLTKELLMI